jgi:ribonuclease BN (tRNA processing enzyme)
MAAGLTVLGSGGWLPNGRRETCCALIRRDRRALLLDAGTGLSRLLVEQDLLDGVEELEIVLTHFHLDHVIGISYLPLLREARPQLGVTVRGPGRGLYGTATALVLERMLAPPLWGPPLAASADRVEELDLGRTQVAGCELEVRRQDLHAHPTAAIRIEDRLALCTDTAADPGNEAFCAGVEVLLHEAWFAADTTDSVTHTAAGEAARIAAAANVGRLLLVHVHPLIRSDQELLDHVRPHFPSADVAHDLLAA